MEPKTEIEKRLIRIESAILQLALNTRGDYEDIKKILDDKDNDESKGGSE